MTEKSDQRGSEPLQTPHDEPTRAGDDSLHMQREAAQNNAGKEAKIDPGHPPRKSRWKKGDPSPNPKGRPPKDQSMLPDVRKLLERAINKKVPVSRGDRKVLMTKLELGFEQQANQAAKGDRHALRFLMDIAPKVGVDFQAKQKQILEEALAPNYQAILDDALARRGGVNVAPTPAVLASPDLLDDDRAESAAPAPSQPKATAAPVARAPAPANSAARATPAAPPLAKTKSASTPLSPTETAPPKPTAISATPYAHNERALTPAVRPPATLEAAPTPQSEAKAAAALELTTPAKAMSAPELEPPLKPGVSYPKPFREMTPRTKWIFFPEWCAEHPEICSQRAVFPGDKR
jgi:Family of unknown function (DUF5681)